MTKLNSSFQIEVKIPYIPGRKLAYAYNQAMEQAKTDWVLLLDWDLFACNPFWYDMCVHAVEQVGEDAGWITCFTNRIGNPGQKAPDPPQSHNTMEHVAYAKVMYNTFGGSVVRIKGALSGFFMLTNKRVWRRVGGFDTKRNGLNGVDNSYSRDIQRAGFKLYAMPGLYYYHIYKQKTLIKWGSKPK